jgi:hypothetical protein
MQFLRGQIRGCPAPMELPDAGHFAQAALAAFAAT